MSNIIRITGVSLFCLFGGYLAFRFFSDGFVTLGIFITVGIVFVAVVFLKRAFTAWRWLAAGLVMALLFTIYPIFYTFYLSFTNMGGGHLLTKIQAINRLSDEMYSPEDTKPWAWTAYRKGNDFLLLLEDDDGYIKTRPGRLPEDVTIPSSGIPSEIDGFTQMTRAETIQNLTTLGSIQFGEPPLTIMILSMQEVAVQLPAYTYDKNADTFTDNRDGVLYSPVKGTYTSSSGKTLTPGYMVGVGWENYVRFLGNSGYLKPVFVVLIWNILFSLLSVLISFGLGLLIALLFNDLKFRRIIRSLLIIPYPIPVLVSIMIWKALLNENMGLVTTAISSIFGVTPLFFTNLMLTRIALIVINVYLSYPYFYVLSSGALKSINTELFEAAAIDGAGPFTVIRKIVMPLVMRILSPLVIASFCFNFNNFTLIWGFNAGLPAMADTVVPMGYTDLLISFIYRLGFSSSTVADYGFIAAISVLLFILVALMVVFQTFNLRTMKDR
ncbi:MAG: ABC transporter permease subunit [Treponema sp.]|nr:ABC transporter permease subunit [Treponema sp.]